jgi:hypothetical protein
MKIRIKIPKWMSKKEEEVVSTKIIRRVKKNIVGFDTYSAENSITNIINMFPLMSLLASLLVSIFAGWFYSLYFKGNFMIAVLIEFPIAFLIFNYFYNLEDII